MSTTLASQLSELSTKIAFYYLIPIYVIGILGNSFNVIIFLRRNLRVNACSQYFVGMSIAQIILLNTLAISKIVASLIGYDIAQTVSGLCKIRVYLYVCSLGLVRQFLCLISIDRWVVSTRNAGIRQWSSLRIVRWLIFGNTLFWILYSIHGLIGFQILPVRFCAAIPGSAYASFYTVQLAVWSVLPFIVMIVFTVLTLWNVRNRPHRIQVLSNNNTIIIVTASVLPQTINRRRREMQLMKLSILQVIFYALLCTIVTVYPLYMYLTISQIKSSNHAAIDLFFVSITLFLLSTHNALTFFVYTLASKTFRQEFLLTCSQILKYIQRPFHN